MTVPVISLYADCAEQVEHAVADRGREPPRRRLTLGDGASDRERVLVQAPDLLHALLHRRQVTGERGLVAERDEVEVDRPLFELDRPPLAELALELELCKFSPGSV